MKITPIIIRRGWNNRDSGTGTFSGSLESFASVDTYYDKDDEEQK